MARVAERPPEATEVRDLNAGAQRMCLIELSKEYVDFEGNPKTLSLSWNAGKPSPNSISRAVRKTLRPGEQMRTTLERAQAWFGMFTLPFVLESIYDESKRESLLEQYDAEKKRAIMTWGEYPRGQATGPNNNGGEIIGPARIPPVTLIVEEADGTQWDAINLRELYELGEYYETTPSRTTFQRPGHAAEKDRDEELGRLREELAKMQGMLVMYAQQNQSAQRSAAPQAEDTP